MSLREVTCSYCNGTGQAEAQEIWCSETCSWVRASNFTVQEFKENYSLTKNRWVDVNCPRCHGNKTYMVEYVTCKIF